MQRSEQINELAAALSKAQAGILVAKKSSENSFFHSKYAELSEIWDVIRGPLTQNGLSVWQGVETEEGRVGVETVLFHGSGQYISSKLSLRMVRERNREDGSKEFIPLDDPQAAASASTYARRIALEGALGVSRKDDDAEAATDHHCDTIIVKEAPVKIAAKRPPTQGALIKQECVQLADKLGIPANSRTAMFVEAKGDLKTIRDNLQASLNKKLEREAAEKEARDESKATATKEVSD